MTLFGTKKIRELEDENLRLRRENTDLQIRITELEHQRFMRAVELEKELIERMHLAVDQEVILRFIFSVERARAIGVPENEILHNHEEITEYFTSEES